jgi:hypothetical protein
MHSLKKTASYDLIPFFYNSNSLFGLSFLIDPSWASVNKGILLCDECCSIHRSLGRHISQVKSLKKGSWSSTLLQMVHTLNNSGVNSVWEHSLLDPMHSKSGRKKPHFKDPLQ